MKKFNYTGKPLTKKQAEEFLERIRLKPKATYSIDENTGKFKKKKK